MVGIHENTKRKEIRIEIELTLSKNFQKIFWRDKKKLCLIKYNKGTWKRPSNAFGGQKVSFVWVGIWAKIGLKMQLEWTNILRIRNTHQESQLMSRKHPQNALERNSNYFTTLPTLSKVHFRPKIFSIENHYWLVYLKSGVQNICLFIWLVSISD